MSAARKFKHDSAAPSARASGRLRRFGALLWQNKAMFVIIGMFLVIIGSMVGYNVIETNRQRPTALTVQVTARQNILVERFIKDTLLVLEGRKADPEASARILRESADALLDGGMVAAPTGDSGRRVWIPAVTGAEAREKLANERTLIGQLLAGGAGLRAAAADPSFDVYLQALRVQGAQVASVTADATEQIARDRNDALSRLVGTEIALGLLSGLAAVGMALLLRRSTHRQSARFRSLVQSSTDIITVLDEHAKALYQSPSSLRMLGYPPERIVGRQLTDLLHPSDRKPVIETFAAAYGEPGSAVDIQFRFRHADGTWILLEGTATNLLADRNVRGFVVNCRDVTERARVAAELSAARDDALSASVTKSQFLAAMSHEIRTPMNAIIGLTGLMLDTSLSDEQGEYARGVANAAQGLLGIINDILDFSKVEAGKLELELVPVDLGNIVEDVASLLGETANAKNIELLTHVQPDVPTAVIGDPTRLRQVLLNLASNAVKFTTEGEVVLRVRLMEAGATVSRVRVEVQDTGVGVADGDLERLFDPFAQADASTTRRFGGTGLGLAIVKQLIELMDGTVGVESTINVGSTFWFEIPFEVQQGSRSEALCGPELAGLRTLVVDDNATNRLILREQLGSWGMEVCEAPDAFLALDLLREAAHDGRPFTVVVLDLNMPDMDGLELARVMRADPALAGAHKFMLSSSGRVAREDAELAGLVGSLAKPVRQSELFNCLLGGLHMIDEPDEAPVVQPAIAPERRGHLLLVEDNSMNQLVATKLLAKMGYTVDVADNGLIALERLGAGAYDAVLMDCQMPEMDGYTATRELRVREADGYRTPVIAMTAAAMDGDREECLAAGMDDYLTKPISPDSLRAALDRWVALPEPVAPSSAEVAAAAPVPEDEPDGASGVAQLDEERLALLRELDDGDGELLREIFTEFLSDATRQVAELNEAVAEGDPETIERAAHSVKGASSNVGASRLAELCSELEVLARGRATADVGALVAAITQELNRVSAALSLVEVTS